MTKVTVPSHMLYTIGTWTKEQIDIYIALQNSEVHVIKSHAGKYLLDR